MVIRVYVWSTLTGCAPTMCAPLLPHLHIFFLCHTHTDTGRHACFLLYYFFLEEEPL